MGQIKKLLEDFIEESVYTFADDLDMDYNSIKERQLQEEYAAYEEMLADSKSFITFDKN